MLDRKIVVYVPSKIGQEPHPEMQAKWKQACLVRLATWFGGATAQVAEGAWMSGDELVIEPVVLCYAYCDQVAELKYRQAVMDLAQEIAADMQQDCVSVEIGGGMEFVAEAA